MQGVVHTSRLSDGSRKIVAVSEVMPLENGEYRTSDLIRWRTDRVTPEGKLEGGFELVNKPTFVADAEIAGIELPVKVG